MTGKFARTTGARWIGFLTHQVAGLVSLGCDTLPAMVMNKQQKLRNTAEGLLAGLVAVGFEGPWRWGHHEWETAFYRVWRQWPPATRNAEYFREFNLGGSANGRTSQARAILFAVNRDSPYFGYDQGRLNSTPMGSSPQEYLINHVKGATPEEWTDLARALLAELPRKPIRKPLDCR